MLHSSFSATARLRASITQLAACGVLLLVHDPVAAQQADSGAGNAAAPAKGQAAPRQAELEAALVEMLSGATLEGSYTTTGADGDPSELSRDKYTLGQVKKIADHLWLIPARIQYADHDVTLPVTVPIYWAGNTPVVVVDNVGLPGFGTVSARVMFFDGHYAGWWKHGKQGGHLFGLIKQPAEPPAARPSAEEAHATPSGPDSPAGEQRNK